MPVLLHLLITYVSTCYPHFRYLGNISRYIFYLYLYHLSHHNLLQIACHTATNCFSELSTTNAKPIPTPMQPRVELMKEQAPLSLTQEWKIQGVPYSKAIRCILWPAIISQPDITFTTRILSQLFRTWMWCTWKPSNKLLYTWDQLATCGLLLVEGHGNSCKDIAT